MTDPDRFSDEDRAGPAAGPDTGANTTIAGRIDELARRANRDADAFEPPDTPPDEDAALAYLVEGAGEAIGVYLDARTGGDFYRFSQDEYDRLEAALNTWLRLYAACHGVRTEPSVTLRTAAEALVDTHDLRSVAYTVTGVGGSASDEPL